MRSATDSILGLIGLATKARKTITGSEACELAIKSGKANLVILAIDASENTKKPIIRSCEYNETDIREFANKEDLGRYTGKSIRAIVVITDPGFAKRMIELIDNMNNNEPGLVGDKIMIKDEDKEM